MLNPDLSSPQLSVASAGDECAEVDGVGTSDDCLKTVELKVPEDMSTQRLLLRPAAAEPMVVALPTDLPAGWATIEMHIPPRVLVRKPNVPGGAYALKLPAGAERGQIVRAMTPDGFQVNVPLPPGAAAGSTLEFTFTPPPGLAPPPCVQANATKKDPDNAPVYEISVPEDDEKGAPACLLALLPNGSLATIHLPSGAKGGSVCSFHIG